MEWRGAEQRRFFRAARGSALECAAVLDVLRIRRVGTAEELVKGREYIDTGKVVGQIATRRHPGGRIIEADPFHHVEALEETAHAMADAKLPALFEAAFLHKGVKNRADILARVRGGKWDLIEVKSAASLKDVNVDDVAVQHGVLRGAGLTVRKAGVLTLNSSYVYAGGDYDVDALFRLHDLTAEVPKMAKDVAKNVKAMHRPC